MAEPANPLRSGDIKDAWRSRDVRWVLSSLCLFACVFALHSLGEAAGKALYATGVLI